MNTTCPQCGAVVVLDDAEIGEGPFTHLLGRVAVWCDSCSEKHERQETKDRRLAELEERIAIADLPASLRGQAFRGFMHPNAEAAAKRWAVDGGGLFLHGSVGVGKTRLAAAACCAALELRVVRWVSVPRFIARARNFSDGARGDEMRHGVGRGAVVLDDVDKASSTDFGRELLFPLIDERVQDEAPLLVTSNLTLSALGERYGDWIASRLAGYCSVFEMAGADRRLEQAA